MPPHQTDAFWHGYTCQEALVIRAMTAFSVFPPVPFGEREKNGMEADRVQVLQLCKSATNHPSLALKTKSPPGRLEHRSFITIPSSLPVFQTGLTYHVSKALPSTDRVLKLLCIGSSDAFNDGFRSALFPSSQP